MENTIPLRKTFALSNEDNLSIFNEKIIPLEFENLIAASSPSVHFIGAQPGAGKSALQASIRDEILKTNTPRSVASIIGDDLRSYHPNYLSLMKTEDKFAAFYTDYDTGKWVELAINFVLTIKPNVIIEGTLRNPETTLQTSTAFETILRLTNEGKVPAVFAPLGPKPISAAMCLIASQIQHFPVYYAQPKSYAVDYSSGSGKTYAYWIKHDGINLYELKAGVKSSGV